MGQISVVLDNRISGQQFSIKLRDDVAVEELLPALAEALSLSEDNYALIVQGQDDPLDPATTLGSAGLAEGSRLRLEKAELPLVAEIEEVVATGEPQTEQPLAEAPAPAETAAPPVEEAVEPVLPPPAPTDEAVAPAKQVATERPARPRRFGWLAWGLSLLGLIVLAGIGFGVTKIIQSAEPGDPDLPLVIGRIDDPAAPNRPSDVAVDDQGNVYVVDWGNKRLQAFDSQGDLLWTYTELEEPERVDIDEQGQVYILDRETVVVLDAAGSYLNRWTAEGATDLFVGEGRIGLRLGGREGGSLRWFRFDGDRLNTVPLEKDKTHYITVGPDNHIYDLRLFSVGEDHVRELVELDEHGNQVRTILSRSAAQGLFPSPTAIAVDQDGWLYYVENSNHKYIVFDSTGTIHYNNRGRSNVARNNLHYGSAAVAVDHEGYAYTVHPYHNRVRKFDRDGQLVQEFGQGGSGPGEFLQPMGTATFKNKLYVCDYGNLRIQIFDSRGKYVDEWSVGDVEDHSHPSDIAISQDGQVYVADGFGNSVYQLDLDGNLMSTWQLDARTANAIAVDDKGYVYVLDLSANELIKLASNGQEIARFEIRGNDIAIAPDGSLWTPRWHELVQWTSAGEELRQWDMPCATIWLAQQGDFFCTTGMGVTRYDQDGNFLAEWSDDSISLDATRYWGGIRLHGDNQGHLYLANSYENYVLEIAAPEPGGTGEQ